MAIDYLQYWESIYYKYNEEVQYLSKYIENIIDCGLMFDYSNDDMIDRYKI